ncbi:MAG: acyltransferase [Desulfobacteraceae bacterium 4572_35.1]|nr:MAG: acyltransferase [Desulfobacteraceae bacterium 4572_35.1]
MTNPYSDRENTSGSTLPIALIQQQYSQEQGKNIAANISAIRKAAQGGAKLVVLSELHTSLYFCQTHNYDNFELAEPIPGKTTDAFAAVAKQENIVLVTSLFERRSTAIYHNSAVVLDCDGSIAGIYRKMHIPDDPGYHEKFYFTPGDLGFEPIATSIGKLGVLICWDQWYPEAARLMTLAGAEILVYPTAIGWDPDDDKAEQQRQLEAWITIQRSHAIANGVPLISVNRVGFEKDLSKKTAGAQFWGNSFVVGAQGEFIARANNSDNTILYTKIDLQQNKQVRQIWPFMRDRRVDAYSGLTQRWLEKTITSNSTSTDKR